MWTESSAAQSLERTELSQRQQHVGRQCVQDPLPRCGRRGSSWPVRRWQSGQSVAAVHRRHAEPDAGVQELGGVSAEGAGGAGGAGCRLRNRVTWGRLSTFTLGVWPVWRWTSHQTPFNVASFWSISVYNNKYNTLGWMLRGLPKSLASNEPFGYEIKGQLCFHSISFSCIWSTSRKEHF